VNSVWECLKAIDTRRIVCPFAVHHSKFDVGSGMSHVLPVSGQAPLPQPLAGSIDNGRDRIYVYGQITYTDVFKRTRGTEFCAFYDPRPNSLALSARDSHNSVE
jgi:hypothetical protein